MNRFCSWNFVTTIYSFGHNHCYCIRSITLPQKEVYDEIFLSRVSKILEETDVQVLRLVTRECIVLVCMQKSNVESFTNLKKN